MSEFKPVETVADLSNLDEDAIFAGYLHGLDYADEPGSSKCRGFWHGWRNAQVDRGRVPTDVAQQRLVHEIVGARCFGH